VLAVGDGRLGFTKAVREVFPVTREQRYCFDEQAPRSDRSTFATVRLRIKVTMGPGSRAARIVMAYKLIDAAQARWRAVNAPHVVALVGAGAVFHTGKLLERPTDITPPEPALTTSPVATEDASGDHRG
jgi:hypothetical protein